MTHLSHLTWQGLLSCRQLELQKGRGKKIKECNSLNHIWGLSNLPTLELDSLNIFFWLAVSKQQPDPWPFCIKYIELISFFTSSILYVWVLTPTLLPLEMTLKWAGSELLCWKNPPQSLPAWGGYMCVFHETSLLRSAFTCLLSYYEVWECVRVRAVAAIVKICFNCIFSAIILPELDEERFTKTW